MVELSQLKPKALIKVLDAYMQTKAVKDAKVPIVTLLLSSSQSIRGVILQCDFDKSMLSIMTVIDRAQGIVTFVDFSAITAISMENLDLCKEFVDKLNSMK